MDRLIDEAAVTTDAGEARQVWKQMTELLQQQQPVTFVYWLNELAANQKAVGNVVMDQRGELLTMPKWTAVH